MNAGKLFDTSTTRKQVPSREAVETAIERAKGGAAATWDIPQKQSSIPHWEAPQSSSDRAKENSD